MILPVEIWLRVESRLPSGYQQHSTQTSASRSIDSASTFPITADKSEVQSGILLRSCWLSLCNFFHSFVFTTTHSPTATKRRSYGPTSRRSNNLRAWRSPTPAKRSLFLELPIKLRLQIYELSFENASSLPRNRLAMLRVCKQRYSECLSISLSYTKLRFDAFNAMLRYWRELSPHLRARVKRVTIPARVLEELYEIPGAIHACCSGLHISLLTLELGGTLRVGLWQENKLKLFSRIRGYLKDVDNIDEINILFSDHEAMAMKGLFCMLESETRTMRAMMRGNREEAHEERVWKYWYKDLKGNKKYGWIAGMRRCRED